PYCSTHKSHQLHSSPTRRSSDLSEKIFLAQKDDVLFGVTKAFRERPLDHVHERQPGPLRLDQRLPPVSRDLFAFEFGFFEHQQQDRKSTRLNSSHVKISYAVFCL